MNVLLSVNTMKYPTEKMDNSNLIKYEEYPEGFYAEMLQ